MKYQKVYYINWITIDPDFFGKEIITKENISSQNRVLYVDQKTKVD
jgi:hypothetical protein